MAVTAVSMLPWPEMMTTGRSGMRLLGDVEHLEAVEAAALQPDVENDELRPAFLDGLQGLVGIACKPRAMAVVLQKSRDHLADIRFVVDDQDVRRHLSLLGSLASGAAAYGSGFRLFGDAGRRA